MIATSISLLEALLREAWRLLGAVPWWTIPILLAIALACSWGALRDGWYGANTTNGGARG